MHMTYTVSPSDLWYIDPADTLAVLQYVQAHVLGSISCTHGHGFTYDFCPIANGNLQLAIDALKPPPADDTAPEPSGEDLTRCQDCAAVRPEGELNEFIFHPERVAPGEPLPVGECPDCGAVCHPVKAA